MYARSILAKISLTGSKFMDALLKDMPIESIPKALGGKFALYNESYDFDTSPTGPFYCPAKPAAPTTAASTAGAVGATAASAANDEQMGTATTSIAQLTKFSNNSGTIVSSEDIQSSPLDEVAAFKSDNTVASALQLGKLSNGVLARSTNVEPLTLSSSQTQNGNGHMVTQQGEFESSEHVSPYDIAYEHRNSKSARSLVEDIQIYFAMNPQYVVLLAVVMLAFTVNPAATLKFLIIPASFIWIIVYVL